MNVGALAVIGSSLSDNNTLTPGFSSELLDLFLDMGTGR
jgi:hypothetical protein